MNTNTKNRSSFISCTQEADGSIDITVPAAMAEEFKLMVKRGTNTYPSKHVEIMDFADRLMGRDSFSGACMKQELVGYPRYPEAPKADTYPEDVGIVSTHWDIPSEDKYLIGSQEQVVVVGKSLLRNSSDTLPDGCYCKPGKCAAPKPEWCRDTNKRDAKKD